jgi:hypothetical protein
MLPYFITKKLLGVAVGASLSFCLRDCGHRGLELKLNLIWYSMHIGVEIQ